MNELLNILESVLGSSRRSSKGNFAFYSPFVNHRKPKLQIDLHTQEDETGRPVNLWHCWISDRKGKSIYSLLNQPEIKQKINPDILKKVNEYFKNQKYNIFIKNDKTEKKYEQETSLPKEYEIIKNKHDIESGIALRYLSQRGIRPHDIIKYKIGICKSGKYKDRIIIPSYDEHNILNWFIARDYKDKHYLKYKNPSRDANIVGFENQINWQEPIILVEGIFDAIAVKRNAIPLMGKTLSEELKYKLYLNDVSDIYVALDGDAIKDSVSIMEYLIKSDINLYKVDIGEKDPADLGYNKMWELIKQSSKIDFKELMKIKLGL